MKIELVQSACPIVGTAPINYDITSVGGASSPNSDLVGALFFAAATTTNDTNVASNRFGFGATDLTNQICIGQGAQDNNATAGTRSMFSTTHCLFTPSGLGGQVDPIGAFNSALSNGIRLQLNPTPSVARLTNTLLISGSDVAMKVGAQYFASSDTTHAITHGLGGTPDYIILVGSIDVASNTNEVDGKGLFIGFWDRATGNMSCQAYHATTGAGTTDNAAFISNSHCGEIIDANGAPSANGHVTVTSIGGTTFTITVSGTGAPVNVQMGWIAMRGIASQMFTGNTVATLPTGPGNSTLISGMSGRPQAYIALPTRMTAVNTAVATDAAGGFGCSVGCTTDFSTTFRGANPQTFKDGVSPSVAKHQISFDRGMVELLNTGVADCIGDIGSWDSGGVTINYSAGAAGAFLTPVLAFGMPIGAGGSHGTLAMMGVGS